MKTKRQPMRESLWRRGYWCVLLALPMGAGILTGSLCIVAGMMLLTDAQEWMLSLMAGISLLISGYGMGRFAGICRRRNGMQIGILCGGLLWLATLFLGILWQNTAGTPLRLYLLCLSGAIGGISGVNAKPWRIPR